MFDLISYNLEVLLQIRAQSSHGRDLNEHTLYAHRQYFYKHDESTMNYLEQ